MPERVTPIKPGLDLRSRPEDRAELLRELDRRDEEILRLRDLLIAKDAELGAARGRLQELAAHSARLSLLALTVRGRLASLPAKAFAALASLRRRG